MARPGPASAPAPFEPSMARPGPASAPAPFEPSMARPGPASAPTPFEPSMARPGDRAATAAAGWKDQRAISVARDSRTTVTRI